jgi:hypothetical protein
LSGEAIRVVARRATPSACPKRPAAAGQLGKTGDVDHPLRRQGRERRQGVVQHEAVDVVLDHDQVVPPADLQDRVPALQAHGGSAGVVQRGAAEQHLGARAARGQVQRLGPQPLVVHAHPDQVAAQHRGRRLDAVEGQFLRQHHVARPRQRAERHQQAVLSATGDRDLLRGHRHPHPGQPARRRRPVVGPPRVDLGGQQAVDPGLGHQLGQDEVRAGQVGRAFREVVRQVDEARRP